MDICKHAHGYVYVHSEPCIKIARCRVPCAVFFYNYKFRDRDDVGHVVKLSLGSIVTLLIMEQIVCIFG